MLSLLAINTILPKQSGSVQWRGSRSQLDSHRRLVERTVRRAYAGWMARFPRWVNSGFDEYFLLNDAMPLLSAMLTGEQHPDPVQLAMQWASAYHMAEDLKRRAITEATPVAADFLARLEIEYCAQQA